VAQIEGHALSSKSHRHGYQSCMYNLSRSPRRYGVVEVVNSLREVRRDRNVWRDRLEVVGHAWARDGRDREWRRLMDGSKWVG
jgi:hypothetical protein